MRKSKIFFVLSLSFIFGIFWRSFFELNYFILYSFSIFSIILLAVFYKNKIIMTLSFAVFFFVFGFWLTNSKLENINNQNLDKKEIALKVFVSKEPQIKEKYQSVVVESEEGMKILLSVNLHENLKYGDEIDLKCLLKIPENRGGEFDYRMYLAKDGIFYLCQNTSYEKTGENKGNKIYLAILKLKNNLEKNISKTVPEPEATLANGLIFGGSSGLPKDVSENFSKTGLSHIVAVSGFNVTIIAEYLMFFGIWIGLWRKQAFWFAVIGILFFVLAIGLPSSAVRAGIMGTLLLWAMKNGRLANSKNAIIFAAGVMLFFNPLLLRWDIGFQLSFLATLGIVEFSPIWEKFVFEKFKNIGFLENVFLTLSATIFVIPIILFNFQTLSIISLLSNFLVLSIIPLAMILIFLTSVAGIFGEFISLPFAWVTFLPLKYIIEIVNYLGNLRWASVKIDNFNAYYLTGWYIVLFVGIFLLNNKLKISNSK